MYHPLPLSFSQPSPPQSTLHLFFLVSYFHTVSIAFLFCSCAILVSLELYHLPVKKNLNNLTAFDSFSSLSLRIFALHHLPTFTSTVYHFSSPSSSILPYIKLSLHPTKISTSLPSFPHRSLSLDFTSSFAPSQPRLS